MWIEDKNPGKKSMTKIWWLRYTRLRIAMIKKMGLSIIYIYIYFFFTFFAMGLPQLPKQIFFFFFFYIFGNVIATINLSQIF